MRELINVFLTLLMLSWSQMWRMVISGSWFDECRRRVISRSKVIPNMVLMIKEGGSFLAIEEEEFHLQWSWLMKINGSFLMVLIIEEGKSFLIWSLRGLFIDGWRKRVNSKRKGIPNMVLRIEGGGSFLPMLWLIKK